MITCAENPSDRFPLALKGRTIAILRWGFGAALALDPLLVFRGKTVTSGATLTGSHCCPWLPLINELFGLFERKDQHSASCLSEGEIKF